ncbi:MAG: TldD/PmbA family protein, partial [Pseudomonadales bacterium]
CGPDLDAKRIEQTIADATRNAEFLARRASKGDRILPVAKTRQESDFATSKPRRTPEEVIGFLSTIDAHIRETYPDLVARSVMLWNLDMEKNLYNSDDSGGYSNTTRSLVMVTLTAHNEAGQPVSLRRPFGGRGQFEDVFEDPAKLHDDIAEVHRHLMNKREAVPARGGTHDVVLDTELAGILAHEAVGHTTEADMMLGGSAAADFMGKQVASPLVTMVDFAHTYEGETLPVPVYVDDEGIESQDTVLIEKGVLKSYMHNKESALHFNVDPTGNARAYQFFDEPLIRMRNTAILPGTDKIEDMIASIDDGYYLMWPTNGQADSTSEFMFGISLGYEIKNGKLGKAIIDTTISGVAFDMLKEITMMSDQMSWSCAGMCGKKQIIPVGMGGPAVKTRIHVGGL